MKSLREIQKEQAEWSDRNFGPQSPERMIFGMMEELGELAETHEGSMDYVPDSLINQAITLLGKICHHRLKNLQGIRSGENDNSDRELIELFFLCREISIRWNDTTYLPVIDIVPNVEKRKDSYADLMIFGLGYVTAAGLGDAEEILNEVWETVRQRDWVKNPKDGVSE